MLDVQRQMHIFLTSPWIPAEWIAAHGLEPRGIWAEDTFCRGAMPLSAGVCAFAEAAVRFAEARRDAAVVFATTCDQLRRGFDSVSRGARVFLFNIPATWQSPAARQLFRGEIERLGLFLQELGGQAPSPGRLREEMRRHAEMREPLRAACGPRAAKGVPLALAGGPLPVAQARLFDAIAAAGGRVVLDATENGELGLVPFDPAAADANPLAALVDGYLQNLAGVFQRPNTPLYDWLRPRLIARQARGIVLWHFTGCDLWRAEAQSLREAFGLPVLLLEADEAQTGSPRDLGRLQAFVETLR